MKLTDLPEKYRMEAYAQMRNNLTHPAPHLESLVGNAPLAAKEVTRFNSPVRIHFHCYRKRLCDIDGISGKAAIDGLVHAGVLVDDSPQYVKEVSYSQEKCAKGEAEKTIITIETV